MISTNVIKPLPSKHRLQLNPDFSTIPPNSPNPSVVSYSTSVHSSFNPANTSYNLSKIPQNWAQLPFIQLTFLNKIVRVYLTKQKTQNPLQDLLHQLACYFQVKTDFLRSIHIIHIQTLTIIHHYQLLEPGASYYLAFERIGYEVDYQQVSDLVAQGSRYVALLAPSSKLFGRKGREFKIKEPEKLGSFVIAELELCQSKGKPYGFTCPLLHCGKQFRRSCDLIVHFMVETGNRPYKCSGCQRAFRRKILLDQHKIKCAIQIGDYKPNDHASNEESHTERIKLPLLGLRKSSGLFPTEELKEIETIRSPPITCSDPTLVQLGVIQQARNVMTIERLKAMEQMRAGPLDLLVARLFICFQYYSTHYLLQCGLNKYLKRS